jgi:hypothetical protein
VRGTLTLLESEVDFLQSMYEPLAAISQDFILPRVETVPQTTIWILEVNRRFIEAYMLGLNDSLSSEVLRQGAPVYLWTDTTRLTKCTRVSVLGQHDSRPAVPGATGSKAVLLVRGDLLKRYPNTLVYEVEAIDKDTLVPRACRIWAPHCRKKGLALTCKQAHPKPLVPTRYPNKAVA